MVRMASYQIGDSLKPTTTALRACAKRSTECGTPPNLRFWPFTVSRSVWWSGQKQRGSKALQSPPKPEQGSRSRSRKRHFVGQARHAPMSNGVRSVLVGVAEVGQEGREGRMREAIAKSGLGGGRRSNRGARRGDEPEGTKQWRDFEPAPLIVPWNPVGGRCAWAAANSAGVVARGRIRRRGVSPC